VASPSLPQAAAPMAVEFSLIVKALLLPNLQIIRFLFHLAILGSPFPFPHLLRVLPLLALTFTFLKLEVYISLMGSCQTDRILQNFGGFHLRRLYGLHFQ
jgi:hypothetical protein